jgi:hypothetical protein
MLDSSQVPIAQSALLVVDVQDSFTATSSWERRNNPDFEKICGCADRGVPSRELAGRILSSY